MVFLNELTSRGRAISAEVVLLGARVTGQWLSSSHSMSPQMKAYVPLMEPFLITNFNSGDSRNHAKATSPKCSRQNTFEPVRICKGHHISPLVCNAKSLHASCTEVTDDYLPPISKQIFLSLDHSRRRGEEHVQVAEFLLQTTSTNCCCQKTISPFLLLSHPPPTIFQKRMLLSFVRCLSTALPEITTKLSSLEQWETDKVGFQRKMVVSCKNHEDRLQGAEWT